MVGEKGTGQTSPSRGEMGTGQSSPSKAARIDFLEGPIFKNLILFAIPLFFSYVFQQLYNTVDTFIVGHLLGETSLAAMGACEPVYTMFSMFVIGCGNGLTIVTARCFGAGEKERLKQSVAGAFAIGLCISAMLSLLSPWIIRPFLVMLKTPSEILEETLSYINVIILFLSIAFAYNLLSGLLRAIGNSMMPLLFLMISSVLNIGMDLVFIVGLGLGVRGAAIATVIAQAISVLLCLIYLVKSCRILVPERAHWKFDRGLYLELFTQGISMGIMNCVVDMGTVILQSGINTLGYLTIAGHSVARKLLEFCAMPFTAMSYSVSTFVSQNYGAGNRKRILPGLRLAYLYNFVCAVIITVLMLLFAPQILHFLTGSAEPDVIGNASFYIRVAGPFFFVLGLIQDTRLSLQGLGDKTSPLLSSGIELVGKIVFVQMLLPRFHYNAVVFCEPVIWCLMGLFLLGVLFRRLRHY